MKTITLILATLLSGFIYSQQIAKLSIKFDKNKVINLDIKTPKTKEELIGKGLPTEYKAIYKAIEYQVYISEKGKMYIIHPNKDNTGWTRKYINQ